MFVKPVKRSKYTLARFSKHADMETSENFRLQQRKKADDGKGKNFQYRIITTGNPYYEIAFSNDIKSFRDNEWKFCLEEVPKKFPININDKAKLLWIVSYFTCLGMENTVDTTGMFSDNEQDERDDLNHTKPVIIPDQPMLLKSVDFKQPLPPVMVHGYVLSSTWRLTGLVCYLLLIIITNLTAFLLRDASYNTFIAALAAFNITMFLFIVMGTPAFLAFSVLEEHKQLVRNDEVDSDDEDIVTPSDHLVMNNNSDNESLSLSRKSSTSSSSQMMITQVTDKGYIPGTSIRQAVTIEDNQAFCDSLGPSYNVRCGPNYKKNQLKAPSGKSLFDVIGMDAFESKLKIDNISQYLDFSKLKHMQPAKYISVNSPIDEALAATLEERKTKPLEHEILMSDADKVDHERLDQIPTPTTSGFHFGSMQDKFMFIITMQLPTEAPSMMTTVTDGPCVSLVWYLRATDETQRDLLRDVPVCPAVALLKKVCLADPTTEEGNTTLMRMKALPRLVNDDDFEFGWATSKTIKKYNGKPFLTRPQHEVYHGPGYFQFDLNVFGFCYLARKVMYGFIPRIKDVILDWAYTIEAYDDSELPEVVLGSLRIFKMDTKHIPNWENIMKNLQRAKLAGPTAEIATNHTLNATNVTANVSQSTTVAIPSSLSEVK